ncbi:MAG: glycosyltransferase family 4 protein [Deltaproteobacteria bacterium]|nr:glycosyltransferase family 4 protein [Deltaproteobacteria bacterium]
MSLLPAIVAFLVAVTTVPVARSFALRKGLLDVPNKRSSHKHPTPRTGGIGILGGSAAGIAVALALAPDNGAVWPVWVLLAALAGGAAVGFIDDLFSIPTLFRMLLYSAMAVLIALFYTAVAVVDLPLIRELRLGAAGGVVFSALFVAWYANLFNFMDGVDGIAGGAAIVALGALAAVFFADELYLPGSFAVVACAATAGFLPYNFPPASVFMGDGGSVFLGMSIGALSLAAVDQGVVSLPASVFFMLPFVFDATFTLFRRIVFRERFWTAHRSHVYQQLCDLGFSHRTVTIAYTGCALLFALIGIMFDKWSDQAKAVVWWGSWLVLLSISVFVVRKNRTA